MYDRKLLAKLSQCAWKVLSAYLKTSSSYGDAIPGAVIAVQTFGDFLNFNPHLHIIATDGCFYGNGCFIVGPEQDPKELEDAFRWEVLKMLKGEGLITDLIIENMLSWYNSGFNVYCGDTISPSDHNGLERLAQYIIRAPISQERMIYVPASEAADSVARVIYQAKDGSTSKTFLAIDWLAHLITHIPNKGEQMVRYYGYYSNKSRGLRKKTGTDEELPALIDTDISKKEFRRNWSRLIQKVYNSDPLTCPKCAGKMRIISIIEDIAIIKKILKHLNLWETNNHDPPEGKIQRGYIPENKEAPNSPDNFLCFDVVQAFYEDDYSDRPFDDDYSQGCEYVDYVE